MRLTNQEKNSIVECILRKDGAAQVFLYGSRLDDNLKGGDIDLLILSESLSFRDKIDLLIELKDLLGDQKIDLSVKSHDAAVSDPFFAHILKVAHNLARA